VNVWCGVCHVRSCTGTMCQRCRIRESMRRMEAEAPKLRIRRGLLAQIASLEAEGVAVIITIIPPRGAATEDSPNE
jgi:hypothetical protein